MKHTIKVTGALVLLFFIAQLVGLLIINQYIDHKKTIETKGVVFKPLPYGFERPDVQNKSISFIYITISILIGTFLALILIRFEKQFIWRSVFFIAVWSTLSIAFAAFINPIAALIIGLVVSILRLLRPNAIIQNLSEVFIYGGLAASLVNIFNLFAAFMLLIVISIYDFVAVFKTKHMIELAEFQSKSKVFAGLLIPYEKQKISFNINPKPAPKEQKTRVAVLGGGDIGFTLIFAGVVMKDIMLQTTVLAGFLKTLIIPVFAAIALLILLLKGQQNKFYPAMPVLSIGCFIGYLVVALI